MSANQYKSTSLTFKLNSGHYRPLKLEVQPMLRNNEKLLNTHMSAQALITHIMAHPKVLPVFDLDGVLLNAEHRINLHPDGSLDLDQYRKDSTLANIMQDKNLPLMAVIHHLNEFKRPYHVATARVLCEGSQALLKQRGILPVGAISRGVTDYRKDWDLKVSGVQAMFEPEQFKRIMLIDDCPSNCDAFINALGAWAINIDINNTPKRWLQELL